MLKKYRPHLDERALNITSDFWGKYRTGVERFGYRLLPRLHQRLHGLSGILVDECVCTHEGVVKATAKVNRVRCSNIFDD